MSDQLSFPAAWAFKPIGARDRLQSLRIDRAKARAGIREVLDRLVDRHSEDVFLPRSVITKAVSGAMLGYCDDMLADATHEIQRELEREIEEEMDRLEKRDLW